MKTTVLGTVLVGLLVTIVAGALPEGREAAAPPRMPVVRSGVASEGMIALAETVEGKYQQVTVIDPKQQVMSVYHVDLASGAIELRSVRNIHWDLQMSDFNGKSPLAQEIQAMAEQR
ncbi:MAG: hypothetical protein NTW96_17655 [Planctomycetia bacterium]|nr:hypothetical protein [Planctomycetia bacterium]